MGVDFIAKFAVHAKKYILCRPECFSEDDKYNIYTDLRQSYQPIFFNVQGIFLYFISVLKKNSLNAIL